MKILYFTATGNSLYIAKRIGGELLSIPQLENKRIYNITDDIVGIVFPIYSWDVPRIVRNYLEKVNIKANYVFTIMTYGMLSMAASSQIEEILKKQNIVLNYSNEIMMVDNFLPIFDIKNQLKRKLDKNIERKLEKINIDIKNRIQKTLKKLWIKLFLTKSMSKKYLAENGRQNFGYSSKEFIVDNNCNGCGICYKVCPIKNIIEENKPKYLDNCEFCLACIHNCSKNSIHLRKEKSNLRYINPNIKLSEIIDANNQN